MRVNRSAKKCVRAGRLTVGREVHSPASHVGKHHGPCGQPGYWGSVASGEHLSRRQRSPQWLAFCRRSSPAIRKSIVRYEFRTNLRRIYVGIATLGRRARESIVPQKGSGSEFLQAAGIRPSHRRTVFGHQGIQISIDAGSRFAPFRNCPYDQRLTATCISRGEDARNRRHIV